MKKILVALFSIILVFIIFSSDVFASEGFIKLENSEASTRCFVQSAMTGANQFSLVVSCRDLIYPPSEDMIHYGLWAEPLNGGSPAYLGTLGLGRRTAEVKLPFSSLFVTAELSDKPKSPSDRRILFGEVRSIEFIGDFEKEIEKLEAKFERQQEGEQKLIEPDEAVKKIVEEKKTFNIQELITKFAFLPVAFFLGVILFVLFLIRRK